MERSHCLLSAFHGWPFSIKMDMDGVMVVWRLSMILVILELDASQITINCRCRQITKLYVGLVRLKRDWFGELQKNATPL